MHAHPWLFALTVAILAIAMTAGFFGYLFIGRTRLGRAWVTIGIGLALVFALGFVMPASAAAAMVVAAVAPSSTTLHIDPATAQNIVNIALALVLALGAMAWKWIDSRSPLKNTQAEDIARTAFMSLLQKGAEFGATQMDSALTKVGSIDVGNAGVAAGANFVIAHGPDLAKALGVDIETPDGQAHIVQSVTARLGTLLGTAAAAQAPIYKIALPTSVIPPSVLATKPN